MNMIIFCLKYYEQQIQYIIYSPFAFLFLHQDVNKVHASSSLDPAYHEDLDDPNTCEEMMPTPCEDFWWRQLWTNKKNAQLFQIL